MDSTHKEKGFYPTSTPIQKLCDSGYGSNRRLRWAKRQYSLSPIKETTPFKTRFKNFQDSIKHPIFENSYGYLDERPFNIIEVKKELDFDSSSDSLIDSVSEFYITNCEEDNGSQSTFLSFHLRDLSEEKIAIIKPSTQPEYVNSKPSICETVSFPFFEDTKDYKLKHRKVDFLDSLQNNLPSILASLLSFIPAEDLSRMCCVSKKWNKTIHGDTKANHRLKSFLKKKNSQKENMHPLVSVITPDGRSCLRSGEHKTVFCNRINVASSLKEPLKKQFNTKFDSFVKAGELEKNILMKCPKCDYAAKNQTEDLYICTECNYEFCKKCLAPISKNHNCSKSIVSMIIGSKKSKRNLKRL